MLYNLHSLLNVKAENCSIVNEATHARNNSVGNFSLRINQLGLEKHD